MTAMTSPWILGPTATPARPARLFCLPFAGGSAAAYVPWRRIAAADIEVIPVQLPGRGGRIRERPLRHLDDVVAQLAAALRPALDRPYAMFGHSMGALLAFETLRALRDDGAPPPAALFVSARRAPHLPPHRAPMHLLSDADLLGELKALNGTPESVFDDQEFVDLLLPIFRADLTAVETHVYRPGAPLDCPIHAFGGDTDRVTEADLAAWAEETRVFSGVTMYSGHHFYLNDHREALIGKICRLFARFHGAR
ncbi:thioesterase II family protein [Chelatococcus reniformis]|nr:alpha/beta fold hydrolase [Chelatococcus reniformis]